jgi:hypothetical protein
MRIPLHFFINCCKHSLGIWENIGDDRLKKLVGEEEYQGNIILINRIIADNILEFKKKITEDHDIK